jgi:Bacterial protein of unknown function (DUF885)
VVKMSAMTFTTSRRLQDLPTRGQAVAMTLWLLTLAGCGGSPSSPPTPGAATPAVAPASSARYEDLLTLFKEWRAFQRPRLVGGVPDYSVAAMAAQHAALPDLQARLAAIDPSGWPVAQQADFHVVRAEMHGLDFDHRVLKPWANNPAFYVTVFPSESDQPAREGPFAIGAVELWSHAFPLSDADAATVAGGLRTIPALLAQARTNLTGTGKDLWTFGARDLARQARDLEALAGRLTPAQSQSTLATEVERARAATADFATWVEQQAATKSSPSGIGEANYDWYLKHVMLVPHTWREVVGLMQRELARAHSSLALEEARNAALPPQQPITSAEEHGRRFPAAVSAYVRFLRERKVMTVRDYMEPRLQERVGRFSPGPREFFTEVDYRDPVVMRTHGYHWFDKGRMALLPHASPIRQGALLYNIFITRTEGLATGWEEMMMHAGLFDHEPRSRELIWILLAQRAARALGDLRMHGDADSIEDAAVFTSSHTPRQWLRLEANLVRSEQHLYLQQPGYGISYVVGKIEIERLLADRKRQLGDRFTLQQFVDELDAAGQIPMSLLRWELTGEQSPELAAMLRAGPAAVPPGR